MKDAPYSIHTDGSEVRVWSADRLPFEPKGWQQDLRRDIRAALAALVMPPGNHLHAEYTSAAPGRFDVENVLLYNVGVGPFGSLAQDGIRLTHRPVTPPPAPEGRAYGHLVTYRTVPANRTVAAPPPETEVLAAWTGIALPGAPATLSATQYWLAVKQQVDRVRTAAAVGPRDLLRLSLTVAGPGVRALNLASAVKPLVDGILSGLARHDGQDLSRVSDRLAERTREQPAAVIRYLMSTDNTPLGVCRMVWARGEGVQWNPPDDRLTDVQLTRVSTTVDSWSCSGHLYRVDT